MSTCAANTTDVANSLFLVVTIVVVSAAADTITNVVTASHLQVG